LVESDLNTFIKNSFLQDEQFAHKIADPHKSVATQASQNPFDGFAVSMNGIYFWESKLIKNEYKAFSFKLIQPHQISNLLKINRIAKEKNWDHVKCLIMLGIWKAHKYCHLYAFDIEYINNLVLSGKKSITKKELLELQATNLVVIKNKMFDYNIINGSIIYGQETI
jgi:penicillin-binding protein-related factor A (putative recombinase)